MYWELASHAVTQRPAVVIALVHGFSKALTVGVDGLEIAKPDGMLVMFRATTGAKHELVVHEGSVARVSKATSAAEPDVGTDTANVRLRESGDEAVDQAIMRMDELEMPLAERNPARRAVCTSGEVVEALNGEYTTIQATATRSGTVAAWGWSDGGTHWDAETPKQP